MRPNQDKDPTSARQGRNSESVPKGPVAPRVEPRLDVEQAEGNDLRTTRSRAAPELMTLPPAGPNLLFIYTPADRCRKARSASIAL